MKNSAIKKACAVLSLLLGAAAVGAVDNQERDQISRSFTLPAKARVEIFAVSGSVDIKAIDGDTAIVQIDRTGRSRTDLDCNTVVLDQASGNLTIRSGNADGPRCQIIQVVHRVLLSLPRHVDVSVEGVSGPINIGDIEGTLRLSGNSGNINVSQPVSGSRITGNSGATTLKLQRLDAGGLELSGNSGTLKLSIDEELSVDVKVSGHSGSVSSELPNVKFTKTGAADYFARIGSGGPTINVEGNSGSVLLSRYRD